MVFGKENGVWGHIKDKHPELTTKCPVLGGECKLLT